MTIDEAIKHCEEVAERYERMEDSHDDKLKEECLQCAADHRQLAEWLTELQELRLQIEAPKLGSIEEYHYELAKCKAAFWSCNRRCMNAEEQYRRKADELRKAQEQIAEYKRLLKSAANVLNMFLPCDEDYNCSECIKQRQNCDYDDSFKWRYADEALKLIGGSENG
jgi:chromosome segregation ATPase